MDPIKVGKAIALLRKKNNMTQKQLADKMNVTYQAVSKWENGLNVPDISAITKIAVLFDIDVESLLEGNISQHDNNCIGILYLDYPEGIGPETLIYTQPLVEFQLAYFMLAGIRDIYAIGSQASHEALKRVLTNRHLGIGVHYFSNDDVLSNIYNLISGHGALVINAPSFIYGKDLTRCFLRIINDNSEITGIRGFNRCDLGLYYIKCKISPESILTDIVNNYISLERGTISFPITSVDDLQDAAIIVRTIERHQDEKINCLEDIARMRNLI